MYSLGRNQVTETTHGQKNFLFLGGRKGVLGIEPRSTLALSYIPRLFYFLRQNFTKLQRPSLYLPSWLILRVARETLPFEGGNYKCSCKQYARVRTICGCPYNVQVSHSVDSLKFCHDFIPFFFLCYTVLFSCCKAYSNLPGVQY